jgi:hypothetical protein
MAVVVQLPVTPASRDDVNALDDAMETVMAAQGGPPPGLMLHVAWPVDEGFMLCQIWRTEAEARASFEESVIPELARLGLPHGELITRPVWSLARP